jgi:hypothetical protein
MLLEEPFPMAEKMMTHGRRNWPDSATNQENMRRTPERQLRQYELHAAGQGWQYYTDGSLAEQQPTQRAQHSEARAEG